MRQWVLLPVKNEKHYKKKTQNALSAIKRSVLIVFRSVHQTNKGLPTETNVSGFNASSCTAFWFSRSWFCRTQPKTIETTPGRRVNRSDRSRWSCGDCQTQIFRRLIKIVNGGRSAESRPGTTVVINNYYRTVVVNKLTRSERSFSNFPQS